MTDVFQTRDGTVDEWLAAFDQNTSACTHFSAASPSSSTPSSTMASSAAFGQHDAVSDDVRTSRKTSMENMRPRYQWESFPPRLVCDEPLEQQSDNADLLVLSEPDSEDMIVHEEPVHPAYNDKMGSSDAQPQALMAIPPVSMSASGASISQKIVDPNLSQVRSADNIRHNRIQCHPDPHHHQQLLVLHGNGGVCIDGVRWKQPAKLLSSPSLQLKPHQSPSSTSASAMNAPAFVDRLWRAFGSSCNENAISNINEVKSTNICHSTIHSPLKNSEIVVSNVSVQPPISLSPCSTDLASSSSLRDKHKEHQQLVVQHHHARQLTLLGKSGWFYGNISWQAANGCLAATRPGTYLVRRSITYPTAFALSVQTIHGPTSIRVHVTPSGRVQMENPAAVLSNDLSWISSWSPDLSDVSSQYSRDFTSVGSLVEYFTRCGLLRLQISVNAPLMALRLTLPLLKRPHSLQHLCRLALNRNDWPNTHFRSAAIVSDDISDRCASNNGTALLSTDACPATNPGVVRSLAANTRTASSLQMTQQLLNYLDEYPWSC